MNQSRDTGILPPTAGASAISADIDNPTSGQDATPSIWSSLRLGSFRYLISDTVLAQTGHQTRLMAQAWLVLAMTGSDTWVGVVNGIPAIPIALLTLLGGTIADRFNRRRLLLGVRATMAALGLIAAYLVATGMVALWHIIVLGVAVSVIQSLGLTTSQAIVVDIVGKPRLMSANAMYSVSVNAASFAGPAAGGLLISAAGVEAAFLLAAGFALVAGVLIWFMRAEQPERINPPDSVWEDLVLGIRYIWATRALRWLLLLSVFVTCIGMFNATLPRMARDELGTGAAGYGGILASSGVGGLIGATALIIVGKRRNYAIALTGSAAMWGVFVISFAFAETRIVASIVAFGVGFMMPWWGNSIRTSFQVVASDEMRGRASSLFTLTTQMIVMGWLFGGVLSDVLGPRTTILVSGIAPVAVYVFVYLKASEFREIGRRR